MLPNEQNRDTELSTPKVVGQAGLGSSFSRKSWLFPLLHLFVWRLEEHVYHQYLDTPFDVQIYQAEISMSTLS